MRQLAAPALGLVLAVIFASHALGQGKAQPEAKQPFEIVRSIQALQDQIVLGNAAAKGKLPKLIAQFSQRLIAANPEVWREAKNARAAIVFTLSGGSTKVIRKVVGIGLSPAPDLELMRGVLAYAEGQQAEAISRLSQIDPTALTPDVGGHIAMIRAALIAKDDPDEALRLLDRARVMLPGTLVEEAALRRALVVADQLSDIDKFEALSREYIWRFPKSTYFESFRQEFATAAIHFSLSGDSNQFEKVIKLIGLVEPASQTGLYLQAAYKGIIDGKIEGARLAAVKARQLAHDGTVEKTRAELYEAATSILTGEIEAGAGELESIGAAQLPRQDMELKEEVISLARKIGDPSVNVSGAAPQDPAKAAVASLSASGASASAAALIDLVQQKLGQPDGVLERKGP